MLTRAKYTEKCSAVKEDHGLWRVIWFVGFCVIWKRHYVEVLKGELNSTSTYVPVKLTKDQLLVHHINSLTKINVKIDKFELATLYLLPKLRKGPYKTRFISNSSHYSPTILFMHIQSALTAIKDHVMKYSKTALSNSNVNYFWSIKNSSEVIEKLRLRNFQGSQVFSFDFFTLYTSLPHDLIEAKVLSLVYWCFNRESKSYLCTSLKAGCFSNKKYESLTNVLARSYVKLLLSSWKTYRCNLKAWYINKKLGILWSLTVLDL